MPHCTVLCRHCFFLLFFWLQIEGLWRPCIRQVFWSHFSNNICSLGVCLSLLVALAIFQTLHQQKIVSDRRLKWWLAYFSIFNQSTYIVFFRYNALIHNRLQCSVNVTFICTGKPKNVCDLLYCHIRFFCGVLEWNPQYLWGIPVL